MGTAHPEVIAVVDDDRAARDALSYLLDALGESAEAFPSAADFLEAGPRNFRRLILDQHMDTMTGLQLVRTLRSAQIDIPVMLISGNLTEDVVRTAADLRIAKVCEKPPGLEDLAEFLGADLG
jgi:FixJ family two-component response regulator